MNKQICKDSFHDNYFKGFPSILDDQDRECSKCKRTFRYINRDGTINMEQYQNGLAKSIQKFQRNRTEWYRK